MKTVLFMILIPYAVLAVGLLWAAIEYYYGVIKPVRREMNMGKCLVRAGQIQLKIRKARTMEMMRQIISNLTSFDRIFSTIIPEKDFRPVSSKLWGLADGKMQEISALERRKRDDVEIGEMTVENLIGER